MMSMMLYKHNQDAYDAVERLLAHKNRTTVVPPMGTGKSMIAFKFVEQHPDLCFLWLSPSENIARVQRKNVLSSDTGAALSNIILTGHPSSVLFLL